jgi:hypothetical protein
LKRKRRPREQAAKCVACWSANRNFAGGLTLRFGSDTEYFFQEFLPLLPTP